MKPYKNKRTFPLHGDVLIIGFPKILPQTYIQAMNKPLVEYIFGLINSNNQIDVVDYGP